MTLDLARIRADFPALGQDMYGKHLTFLDSAASAQKPRPVLDALRSFYEFEYANVHRGVYWLSQRATERYEQSRAKVRAFLNAARDEEIVFVRGATEGINLVAQSWGRAFLQPGDEVVISAMEHHSNIVPWQMLRDERGIVLRIAPITDDGDLDLAATAGLIGPRTKLVAIAHVANALGTILPVREVVAMARKVGAKVLVDGCQAVPHMAVDVRDLDVDFYVFSGHKLYGPTGIGILYARHEHLVAMPPWQGGGDMIRSVTFEKTEYADPPAKFEAGTPHIAGAVGLGAAIDYVQAIGFDAIVAHERDLMTYATERLGRINSLRIIGTSKTKSSVISFTLAGVHPHDIGTILDREGIAIRAGHHCAQPVMDRFDVAATARASFGIHNGRDDVDALVAGITKVLEIFA
ncbi:MAG: aminotransferase class V-fold PLP-dependent enzyme [Ferrovibrionaceae bacterium]